MKGSSALLLVAIGLSMVNISVADTMHCKNAGHHLTAESKILLAIKPGITTADEAEACLIELQASYTFQTKSIADIAVPRFDWRSPQPKGYLVGFLPGRTFRWFVLADERIRVKIEIDSHDLVAQVVTEKVLTGL